MLYYYPGETKIPDGAINWDQIIKACAQANGLGPEKIAADVLERRKVAYSSEAKGLLTELYGQCADIFPQKAVLVVEAAKEEKRIYKNIEDSSRDGDGRVTLADSQISRRVDEARTPELERRIQEIEVTDLSLCFAVGQTVNKLKGLKLTRVEASMDFRSLIAKFGYGRGREIIMSLEQKLAGGIIIAGINHLYSGMEGQGIVVPKIKQMVPINYEQKLEAARTGRKVDSEYFDR